MKHFITIVVNSYASASPCLNGVRDAVESFYNDEDDKVVFIGIASETGETKVWSREETPSISPQPRRTMWANLSQEAQDAFRLLAQDFGLEIQMYAASVEAAIAQIPQGACRTQAQRIYDAYVS